MVRQWNNWLCWRTVGVSQSLTWTSGWSWAAKPLIKTQLQERSVVNPTCERILEKECGCLLVRYVVSNTWSSRTEVDCCSALKERRGFADFELIFFSCIEAQHNPTPTSENSQKLKSEGVVPFDSTSSDIKNAQGPMKLMTNLAHQMRRHRGKPD